MRVQVADARKKMAFCELGTLVENRKKEIKELENTIKRLEFKNIVLQEKYDLLVYKRFVRTSEAQDETRLALFDEDAAGIETGKEGEVEKETITCQRKQLFNATERTFRGCIGKVQEVS
jgi:hypothetical protein